MKYTGFDGNVKAKRPAMEAWIKNALTYSQLKNLGSWVVREQRSSGAVNHAGIPSVHGTGRAVDIGFSGVENGRAKCERLLELLTTNFETLGVEMILDYYPKPFGRGWRVDRKTWQTYTKATIAGAPGGNWIHVEVTPKLLETVAGVNSAWTLLTATKAVTQI
jgi:hypothetical protein